MSHARLIMMDDSAPTDARHAPRTAGDSRRAREAREAASELEPWAYPGLRALVQSDIQVWGEQLAGRRAGEPVGLWMAIRLVLVYAGLRAALLSRLAFAADRARIPILPLILANLNLSLHGFDMPPHIEVGPRFYMPHPVGTVVTARRIGAGVTLVSAVTIGMRNGSDFPLLGDDVYVGAGARILGAITIGDRVQIGANAVVLKDVPAESVAVGVPATIRRPRPNA